eukprot:355525-Chlamydomonas_euryale.AAC.1
MLAASGSFSTPPECSLQRVAYVEKCVEWRNVWIVNRSRRQATQVFSRRPRSLHVSGSRTQHPAPAVVRTPPGRQLLRLPGQQPPRRRHATARCVKLGV